MADIRINSLPSTASASSSDDFLAIDGATNGTRKLNAFSPTFGGNLTVSGTGTSSVAGVFKAGTDIVLGNTSAFQVHNNVDDKPMIGFYRGGTLRSVLRLNTDNDFRLLSSDLTTPSNLTIGNLTVSGTGTSSFAGPLTVSLSQNADTELRLTNTNAGASARAAFILTGQASSFGTYVNNTYVQNYTPAALDLQWWTSGTQHLTLKSGGNLLIGTTTDGGQKLQVSGNARVSNSISVENNLTLTTTSNPRIYWNSGQTAWIDYTSDAWTFRHGGTGTTSLTLASTGNATFAGSIAIGNTVQTAVGVASTHKVTISIGGSTYYLLATNV